MDIKKMNNIKKIYTIVFFIVNIMSCYLVTTDIFIENLSPFPRNIFMLTNSFFGDFGFLLLFLGLSILLFKSDYKRAKFLMIVSIVFSILYLGITVYFQYYGMFFSFYNLAAFSSAGGGDAFMFLLDSVLTLLAGAEFVFIFSALVMIIIFIVLFRRNRKIHEFINSSVVKGYNRIYIGVGIIITGALIMTTGLSAYKVQIDDTWFEDNTTPLYGTQTVGFFNYYVYDAYSYFFTNKPGYNQGMIEEIKNKLELIKNPIQTSIIDNNQYDNNNQYKGVYEGKNLLLIQVESLNNFVIGLKVNINGEIVEVTPNLNRIVQNSVYFNNYYTSVGIGNTSDSEFTNLTGINPVGSTYTVYEYADANYQALPKLFREAGYSAFSSHANTGTFYERATLHPKMYGFEYHYAEEDMVIEEGDLLHTWLNDVDFLEQTIDIMKEESLEGPVFTFAITVSNHMPYKKPTDYGDNENWFDGKSNLFPNDFELVSGAAMNSQFIGYLEHVSYTDYAIGEALKKLEENGLAEDTIVILYGDHGSNLDIHEMFYQSSELFNNDINEILTFNEDEFQRKLLERRLTSNIPFIIYDPTYEENSNTHILKPQTISLVRGSDSTTRTIANLFNLNPTYYFGVDALSNAKTFAYNPRNLDIVADGIVVSGQSLYYTITDDSYKDFYTQEKVIAIVDEFLKYKDFNDKILKCKIFGE